MGSSRASSMHIYAINVQCGVAEVTNERCDVLLTRFALPSMLQDLLPCFLGLCSQRPTWSICQRGERKVKEKEQGKG